MSSDGCAFKSLTEFVRFGLNDDQMVVFLKMGVLLNALMSLVWFEWWLTSDGSVLKSLAQFGLVWFEMSHLAGTAVQSSQKERNEEVTRMIPEKGGHMVTQIQSDTVTQIHSDAMTQIQSDTVTQI